MAVTLAQTTVIILLEASQPPDFWFLQHPMVVPTLRPIPFVQNTSCHPPTTIFSCLAASYPGTPFHFQLKCHFPERSSHHFTENRFPYHSLASFPDLLLSWHQLQFLNILLIYPPVGIYLPHWDISTLSAGSPLHPPRLWRWILSKHLWIEYSHTSAWRCRKGFSEEVTVDLGLFQQVCPHYILFRPSL